MSVLRKTLLWLVLAGCPLAGQAFTQEKVSRKVGRRISTILN